MSALAISGLRVDVSGRGDDVVADIDLVVDKGEVLGLVGESGSGKTTVALSVLGRTRRGVEVVGGSIVVAGHDVLALDPAGLRRLRGGVVGYVPQHPASALNPALRIGTQIAEVLDAHGFGETEADRRQRTVEVLGDVLLPGTPEFLRSYPHQLSGGQQHRVALAIGFACRPELIVLDEPTTGLDTTTQAHVLATIRHLCHHGDVAALYITHDLAVVADLADRVAVMYAGRIVEHGPTKAVFARPAHPYTRHLIEAEPDIEGERAMVGLLGRAPSPGQRPRGCSFAPRCHLAHDACRAAVPTLAEVAPGRAARCVVPFAAPGSTPSHGRTAPSAAPATPTPTPTLAVRGVSASHRGSDVVRGVTLDVGPGECVALVGGSGAGKSTLVRSIGGLHAEWTGEIYVEGMAVARSSRSRSVEQRLALQSVFQHPAQSLNPRRSVGESVERPLIVAGVPRSEARRLVLEVLERVSLDATHAAAYPDQLSGGEIQRAAIARAVVGRPKVLLCDEVTSSLDVLVQAAIVDLLGELRGELGLSMLFVTHNLAIVRNLAGRVVVMADGRVVESGPVEQIFTEPQHEHTRRLLQDAPRAQPSPPPRR